MLYELMVSFSEPAELIRHRGLLIWPLGFDTTAYQLVLSNHQILTGYANTLFILVVGLDVYKRKGTLFLGCGEGEDGRRP